MMRSKYFNIRSMLLLGGLLLAACQGSSVDTPSQPDKGAVRGQIEATDQLWPGEEVYVYAAPFEGEADGQGVYVLETSSSLIATLKEDGSFRIDPLPAGEYVLVVGPAPEEGRLIRKEGGAPWVVETVPGQVVVLGNLTLDGE